uniref:Uncharacterized protein n=1 Tax=Rhizophora mucronata TaxID=61149 RepID=A0A2P2PPT2_RHIMU
MMIRRRFLCPLSMSILRFQLIFPFIIV